MEIVVIDRKRCNIAEKKRSAVRREDLMMGKDHDSLDKGCVEPPYI